MSEISKAKRKIALRITFLILAVLTPVIYTMPSYVAYADAAVVINATENDFYNKLKAAGINYAVAWMTKRCMSMEYDYHHHYEPSDVKIGKVIKSKDSVRQLPLWLEWKVDSGRERDGKIHCWDGNENNRSIFHQFMHYMGLDNGHWDGYKYNEIFCDGGGNGMLEKWTSETFGIGETKQNSGCDIVEDGYHWRMSSNWETYLKKAYEKHKEESKNPYMIDWDKLYEGFDNIGGYFNYIEDFNLECQDVVINIYDEPDSKRNDNRSTYPIRYFDFDKESLKLTAKDKYYYIKSKNKSWTPITDKSIVNNCTNALIGIRRLEDQFNGVNNRQDAPEAGYEGVILYYLHDNCAKLKTDDGKNAWEELRTLINTIITDSTGKYSEANKQTAKEDLELMDKWKDNDYVVEEGKEEDKEGKKYWCLDVEEMNKKLEDFDDPALHVGDENPGDGDKDNCYSKAGSLGWILCPIIESARTAIIESYGTLVEPALQMDSCLFIIDGATKPKDCKNTTDGTYQAWKIFRDIANVAFVILFIIVIFSQVTGFGIDNYGVKKALPKLLVAAVLINLSFIICQGAIDLCNITGKGIGGLFQSITKTVGYPDKVKVTVGDNTTTVKATDEGSWQDTNTWGKSFASNWLGNSALVILVAALGIGIVLSQGLAIIIPVFMLLISVVVAILGLVAILGIRQAVAVLLVVVSPLAFACYILPNTKSIFDKWFKTFQGLLLAYPICSALVYGGDMAATILMNAANGNLWVLISAAVISVAPIFIIPKIIRSSMGALSGGIANLSHRMGGYAKGKARGRMENSALTNRRNYNQMMRNQKHAASASQYNAKRGKQVLSGRIGNKLAKGGQLTAAQRRKYNVAMGAVNANNQDSQNAYASSFDGIGDDSIESRLMGNIDSNGRIKDTNMLIAGLNSIHDEDKLTRTVKKLSETGALDKLAVEDKDAYHRIAQAMQSRKDSVINQSIGKLMDKGETVSGMYASGSLKKKVQDAGTSVMATQNKDVFNTEGAAELFSDDQLRAGLTAGYSGGTAAAFHNMMQNVDDERMGNIVDGMTGQDVSNLKSATVQVKGDDGEMHEKEVGALATIGRGSVEAGGKFVQDHATNAVNQLRGVEGDELRPNMDEQTLKALNIKNAAPAASDGSDTPAAAGGEPTIVDSNPNQSSISSGINVNNMTEDDYNYIQWQHDHNPGSDAPAAEGGMTIDHGNSSSSTSSNDHHFSDHSAGEGHATGSVARAEARAAGESSSTTSGGTMHVTPPAGSSVPHAAAPTAPDLNPVSSTGTKRDAEGHVVGERAKEGNYFDYHPKQKGENNAAYSARNAKEHEMEKVGYSIAPKGANETGAEYRARVSKALKDAGLSGGKPADSAKPADSGPKITTNHHKS